VSDNGAGAGASTRVFTRKKLISFALSLILVVAIFWFVLPQIADFSKVWSEIRDMTWLELVFLTLFSIWNLVTYWIIICIATPGLKLSQSAVVTETTTAVANTIPAGGAVAVGLNYAMLGSWGFSKSRITLSVVVSGIWNNFVKLGLPIFALALLLFEGGVGGGRVVSGVLGLAGLVGAIVVFALILHSEEFANRIGEWAARVAARLVRLFRKPAPTGWGGATAKFRARVIGLVRHSWISLTVWTLISHLSLYFVLLVTLRDVGVAQDEVSWTEVLAVFAFVRLLTAIPLTPGGLGIIELGLIGGLSHAGGEREQVVAAVLVFRALTYVLPILLGVLTYVYWRRNTSWLDSAPPLDPAFTPLSPASAST
jgi:uncharacterized protein (TIRG00374 family)